MSGPLERRSNSTGSPTLTKVLKKLLTHPYTTLWTIDRSCGGGAPLDHVPTEDSRETRTVCVVGVSSFWSTKMSTIVRVPLEPKPSLPTSPQLLSNDSCGSKGSTEKNKLLSL